MEKRSKPCGYTLLADARTVEARFRLAIDCAGSLRNYRDNFHELERCPGIAHRMTERAYEAERNFRVLTKIGLDSINDIWDSREAASMLNIPSMAGKDLARELSAVLPAAKGFFKERYDLDVSPLDEACQLLEKHKIQVSSSRGGEFTLEFRNAAGRPQRQTFHIQPRPGDTGRVSAEKFFSPGDTAVFGRLPGIYDKNNCHSAAWSTKLTAPASLGTYDALVGSLRVAREMIYRHAREVETYGPAHVRGAAPAAAAVVALVVFVVGLCLLGAGAVIHLLCQGQDNNISSDVCTLGDWLMGIGGVLTIVGAVLGCATGNCAFIFGGKSGDPELTDPHDPSYSNNFPMNNPSSS